jgi:hypothetical protein
MNDLMIQFARLWGQYEAYRYSAKDEEISDMLKGYNSLELLGIVHDWAEEYCLTDAEDTVEFFEQKIEEMYEQERDNKYTPSAENGDYSPSNPWDAPGMSMKDFI